MEERGVVIFLNALERERERKPCLEAWGAAHSGIRQIMLLGWYEATIASPAPARADPWNRSKIDGLCASVMYCKFNMLARAEKQQW
eukprot:3301076-Prymnesium_polylepis.1